MYMSRVSRRYMRVFGSILLSLLLLLLLLLLLSFFSSPFVCFTKVLVFHRQVQVKWPDDLCWIWILTTVALCYLLNRLTMLCLSVFDRPTSLPPSCGFSLFFPFHRLLVSFLSEKRNFLCNQSSPSSSPFFSLSLSISLSLAVCVFVCVRACLCSESIRVA